MKNKQLPKVKNLTQTNILQGLGDGSSVEGYMHFRPLLSKTMTSKSNPDY